MVGTVTWWNQRMNVRVFMRTPAMAEWEAKRQLIHRVSEMLSKPLQTADIEVIHGTMVVNCATAAAK